MVSTSTPQPRTFDGVDDRPEILELGNSPNNIPMQHLAPGSSEAAAPAASAREISAPGNSAAADADDVNPPSPSVSHNSLPIERVLRGSAQSLAIERNSQNSADSLAIHRVPLNTTVSFVEVAEPFQPPNKNISPQGEPAGEYVDIGRNLRGLDADRRQMERAIGALERTLGKQTKSYASRTLNQEWVTSIENLVKLREHSKKTTDKIRKIIGRTAWSKEERYISPETRELAGAGVGTIGANTVKEIVWYGPAAIKKLQENFGAQFGVGWGGAWGGEYPLQQWAARKWKGAGGNPVAFIAASQISNMAITPAVLGTIAKVKHKEQSATSLLPFAGFMVSSAITAGWEPKWLKKLRGAKAVEFVVSAGGNVKPPKGVQAHKQADDLKFLNGVLFESMEYGEMHQRIVAANTDLATHYRQHPGQRSKSAATKNDGGAIDISAAPDTASLKAHLTTTENMLRTRKNWTRREYGFGLGSLAVTAAAGAITAVTGKKNPTLQSMGYLFASGLPQGVAQLAPFIHIPGEEKYPEWAVSQAKIAGPLGIEYLLLQLGTKRAEEAPPGAYPDLPLNRFGQEAGRNCIGSVTGWGLAGDQLGANHVVGCLTGVAVASVSYGVEWKKAHDSQKILETQLLAASDKPSDDSISMRDEDTVNSNRSEMEPAPMGARSKQDPGTSTKVVLVRESALPYSDALAHYVTRQNDASYGVTANPGGLRANSRREADTTEKPLKTSASYSKQVKQLEQLAQVLNKSRPSVEMRLERNVPIRLRR